MVLRSSNVLSGSHNASHVLEDSLTLTKFRWGALKFAQIHQPFTGFRQGFR